jgi:hypothetical protein
MNPKLKLNAICSPTAYQWLQRWIISRAPSNRYPLRPEQYFYSNTKHREYLSKFIESVIILVLRSKGADPIKANDKGRSVDASKVVTNVLGHQRTIGGRIFVKDKSVRPGRADITVFFSKTMYLLEIKVGHDRMSEAQKQEQARAEANGEKYVIIKTVDDFINLIDPPSAQ